MARNQYPAIVVYFNGEVPPGYKEKLTDMIEDAGWTYRSIREKQVTDITPVKYKYPPKPKLKKYTGRVPPIVKTYLKNLKPGDRIKIYWYEQPQVQLIRGVGASEAIIYCEVSLFEYLRSMKLIVKGVRSEFIEEWRFGSALMSEKGLKKYFRWMWNVSVNRSINMSINRRNGTVTPSHQKRLKNPLPPKA